jgi:hypothetical protein
MHERGGEVETSVEACGGLFGHSAEGEGLSLLLDSDAVSDAVAPGAGDRTL